MTINEEDFEKLRDIRGAEFFERYGKPHPYAHNLLQGHLYIEEQLAVIVMSVFAEPEAVIEAKLGFWTKLKLAQAVVGKNVEIWPALEKLNSARNALAHGLDITFLERKIDEFLITMPDFEKLHEKDASRAHKLSLAIIGAAAYITRTAEGYRPSEPGVTA